ncbi:STAS domain-containing protein [Streptomyces sp. NPDC008121]|uniref:STAS domain-containing protein n=1 Tax=Streptomyces sp. NPDC008121 TaxID=3364809 RepID=UPI0036EE3E74
MHSLHIDVTAQPGRVVVTVAGELDTSACLHITEVTDALDIRGQTLTLDLSCVPFMHSSALDMLLDLRRRARAEGATLELFGIPAQAARLLDSTGTRHLFTVRAPTWPSDSSPS